MLVVLLSLVGVGGRSSPTFRLPLQEEPQARSEGECSSRKGCIHIYTSLYIYMYIYIYAYDRVSHVNIHRYKHKERET